MALAKKISKKSEKKKPTRIAPSQRTANEVMSESEVEEFLPYTCHYDPHTLLTKNGELVQVIKLTGFNFESIASANQERLPVRTAIRKAIAEAIQVPEYAIWLHTVRRRTNLAPTGNHKDTFSKMLNQAWVERHDWTHKYMNELYITVIIQGTSLALSEPKNFLRSLAVWKERRYHTQFLENSCAKLTEAVDILLENLRPFGARRLSTIKGRDGIYYSEPMQFFCKIINLEEEPFPMALQDLSEVMPQRHQVFFGFNA
ncbi:MAG: hypothetical protein KDD76_03120, partial [Rickettsiales bacterium]|nr:hypothetical protein [Rickettsiales bacterium]